MSNFFIALAVFCITIIGALFAVPYFVDWNGYRGFFEEEASRILSRDVRVGGAVNLHLLPTPYFRLEKVRIADVSGGLQEPFFRADSLTIRLSVPPIFRGMIEANEIEFQRPILRLAPEKDGWNWQTFAQSLANNAYLPANVALTSLKISDAVLALHGYDGMERLRLDNLNGELSAPSLVGPYRFRGTYRKGGAERELRIATAPPDPDGSVRFKISLRAADSGSAYTVDARLLDLMADPKIAGDLIARLPIASLSSTSLFANPAMLAKQGDAEGDRFEAAFDVRAKLNADAAGAKLSDLALSFEQGGRPQLITGEIKATWRDALAFDLALSSRWLDLDRIAGAPEDAGPLYSLMPFAIRARDLLPADGRSRATLSIEQANIGHEAISGLHLTLSRTNEKLQVDELRLAMPGNSRGDLKGTISGPPDAPVFNGSLGIHGSSLVRFVSWFSGNALRPDARGDGAFGIRTHLTVAPGIATARDFVADLSGMAVNGSAHYRWDERPELGLSLEAPQLDLRAFAPAGGGLVDLLELATYAGSSNQTSKSLSLSRDLRRQEPTDLAIRIDAGQVLTANRTYRDVAAAFELRGGHLKLPLFRLAGDAGFDVEFEGDVENAASRPKGAIRGVVNADTTQGVEAVAELLGMPQNIRDEVSGRSMSSLHVGGSLTFGGRTPTSADLAFGGEINSAPIKFTGRFDGGANGWRSGHSDLTLSVEASAGKIAGLINAGGMPQGAEGALPGRILAKADGIPAKGLASFATVEAGDITLNFRGELLASEDATKLSGKLDVKTADGTRLASLAGLASPLSLEGIPVAGMAQISAAKGALKLDQLAMRIGSSTVRGQVALGTAGAKRHVEARIEVDELILGKLLATLLDNRLAIAGTAESALSGRQSTWPDEPFDAAPFAGFEGNLHLASKHLTIADGVGLGQTTIDVAFEQGKVEVKRLEGDGLGGRCIATISVEKVPAGAEVAGTVQISGAKLEALTKAESKAASGTMNAEVKFAGKGTSPRSAISSLKGAGVVEFANGKLSALWPGAVRMGIEAAFKAEPNKMNSTFRDTLIAGLSANPVQLPARLPVEIEDGQLRVKPFAIDAAEGRSLGGASLDLRTLTFQSDWRIEQKAVGDAAADRALPPISVSYGGMATALGSLEPRFDLDALERELSVRRMERDVEELERLRKLDEARRRSEIERLRQQLERSQPPVVPGAPAGTPGLARPAAPG